MKQVYRSAVFFIILFYSAIVYGANGSLTSTAVSVSNTIGCEAGNYVLTGDIPNNNNLEVNVGATITVTFPAGTDATTATNIIVAQVSGPSGSASTTTYTNPTTNSISFSNPYALGRNKTISVTIEGVTNPSAAGSGLSVSISMQNASAGTTSGSHGTYSITAGTAMSVNSVSTTQNNVSTVIKSTTDNEIVGVEVVTTGSCNPISVTALTFSTNGSTSPTTDITNAKLYYTATSSTFATTTQLGAAVASPNGSFSFSGFSQPLPSGTGYFWLAYDIPATAVLFNVVDAECSQVTTTAGSHTPVPAAPAGSRPIGLNYCAAGNASAITSYISNVKFNNLNNTSVWEGYALYAASTQVRKSLSYTLSVTTLNATTSSKTIAAWIDWNNDGIFSAGEQVMPNTSITTASPPVTAVNSQSVTIPNDAFEGSTIMRVGMLISTTTDACNTVSLSDYEDYVIEVLPPPSPMAYVSSNCQQTNISNMAAGVSNQDILSIEIVTTGSLSALSANAFTFNTNGTTNTADLEGATLYYTGSNGVFSTDNPIGAPVATPSGAFSIAPSQTLSEGTNYFWLAYDVPVTATGGNFADAECTDIDLSSGSVVPTTTAPAGNRKIDAPVDMYYVQSELFQFDDVSPRGGTNQPILGINVQTAGVQKHIILNNIKFNTNGSTAPSVDIDNAKLYYTGANNGFSAATQVGNVVVSPAGSFIIEIDAGQVLSFGNNYFWLTYDVSPTANCIDAEFDPSTGRLDAEVELITIGSTEYTPTNPSPEGYRYIGCGTPYFSKGNLPANELSSWSTTRDGTGPAPASFSTSYNFYVQSEHSMTTSGPVTIPFLFLENAANVFADELISMTTLRISSDAVYEQTAAAGDATYIQNFVINNGGTWVHNNTGFLPGANRYFSANSNQLFKQVGGGTFPSGTFWGNVIFDISTVGNFNISNAVNNIQGNFEIRRTGADNYYVFDPSSSLAASPTETYSIGGDFILSGGQLLGTGGASTPPNADPLVITMNIAGSFRVSGGTLYDYRTGVAGNHMVFNINGDVQILGGEINLNRSPNELTEFNLTGTDSVTWRQSTTNVTLPNTDIAASKAVTLTGSHMGNIASGHTILLNAPAKLYTELGIVSGAGTLQVPANATLGIGSANGITVAPTAAGNVQTTTRSLSAGAKYYYNGPAPQTTGDALPTALNQATSALILDNIEGATLSQATTIGSTGALTLLNGALTTTNTNIITIDVSATATSANNQAFVNGPMDKNTNTTTQFIFPVGKVSTKRPMAITPATTDATTFRAEYFEGPYPNVTTFDQSQVKPSQLAAVCAAEYWMLDRNSGTANANVTLYWDANSNLGSIATTIDSITVAKWNGTAWTNTQTAGFATKTGGLATNGTVSITTPVTSFSPFTIGSTEGITPLNITEINLKASRNNNQNNLMWTTVGSSETSTFTIEKSATGNVFRPLGYQAASLRKSIYNYADQQPGADGAYYRIACYQNGRLVTYSNTVFVEAVQTAGIKLFPTVFNRELTLEAEGIESTDPATVEIINLNGQRSFYQQIPVAGGQLERNLQLPNLPTGMYLARVYVGQRVECFRLIKK